VSDREIAIDYCPGTQPTTQKAPYDAVYTLHLIDTEGQKGPALDRATIEQDYHVGFVRQPDGTLTAYAGGRTIPLDEGSYLWEMTAESPGKRRGLLTERTRDTVVEKSLAAAEFLLWLPFQMLYAFARAGH
jgi:hypothetical protein